MNPRKSVPDFAWAEHLLTLHRLTGHNLFTFRSGDGFQPMVAIRPHLPLSECFMLWPSVTDTANSVVAADQLDRRLGVFPNLVLEQMS